MNGISSNLKEEIKKGQQTKKRERIRFLAALLISNAMVAILCLPGETNEKKAPPLVQLRPAHQFVILKLKALVEIPDDSAPVPVSILTSGRQMLINKAYLHSAVSDTDPGDESRRFKIEIHESEILKTNALLNEELIAIPYVEQKISYRKKSPAGGSRYETAF